MHFVPLQASPSYHRDGQRHSHGDVAVAVLALALQVIVLIFGYITWGQFGWRTYSKLAADMRVTDVEQQRWSFVLVNCFTTLVKLDIQVTTHRNIVQSDTAQCILAPAIDNNSYTTTEAVKHRHKAWVL